MSTKTLKLGKRSYELPMWANFIARDKDGSWWYYAVKPAVGNVHGEWHGESSSRHNAEPFAYKAKAPEPGDWDTQLYALDNVWEDEK